VCFLLGVVAILVLFSILSSRSGSPGTLAAVSKPR
jgi:hypothetical protein